MSVATVDKMVEFVREFDYKDIDEKFVKYVTSLGDEGKMTGAGLIHVLNYLSSVIDQDCCYMEIGSWCGASLCGAAINNSTNCVGIDNFSQFDGARAEKALRKNIERLGLSDHVICHKMSYQKYLQQEHKDRAQVLFYDGHHGSGKTKEAMSKCKLIMADKAIFIVDDIGYRIEGPVFKEMMSVCNKDKEYTVIRHLKRPAGKLGFHCGVSFLLFERRS
jgi:prepilin-type processing-associated H-X9-DG protein